jgi:hypothetical protein
MKLIDLTGQKFGRLTVLRQGETRKNGGSDWVCLCDCGETTVAVGSRIRLGKTKSCGCLGIEWAKSLGANKVFIEKRANALVVHGHKRRGSASVEYKTWLAMKRRCYDPKCKDYANWGGRGIKVCDRWVKSFTNFFEDMGLRPDGNYSIDRLRSNEDYSPDNCRWATLEEQGGENRRDLTSITIGELSFHSIAAACRHFGVKLTTAHYRISSGIPIEQAVSFSGRLSSRRDRESYIRKDLR